MQPFLAISALLLRRNSVVAIATHEEFQKLVLDVKGCVFFGLDGCPMPIMKEFKQDLAEGSIATDIAFSARVAEAQKGNRRKMWEAALEFKPTLIVSMMSCHLECISIATRLGVPSVVCSTYPLYPSRERMPMSMMSNHREFPIPIARIFSSMGFKVSWAMTKNGLNEWRSSLGLDALSDFSWDACPMVNIFSPSLAHRPKDWPPYVYDCGFCFYEDVVESRFEPDGSLAEFFASGSAPIYFGFGSMPVANEHGLIEMYVRVCAELGRRGVVLLPDATDSDRKLAGPYLYLVDHVPHWWLFPKCSVAVFHGGAGTTASALKAGIPCNLHFLLGKTRLKYVFFHRCCVFLCVIFDW